jgi:hypothetical protein
VKDAVDSVSSAASSGVSRVAAVGRVPMFLHAGRPTAVRHRTDAVERGG